METNADQEDLFQSVDDPILQRIGEDLIQSQSYHDLFSLLLVNTRFHRTCQDLLNVEHARLGGQPPNLSQTGDHFWLDAQKQYHRGYDLPAIVFHNGRQEWYQHGQLHRKGDRPASIFPDGRQEWYQHGFLHRDGKQPAYINDHLNLWFENGILQQINDCVIPPNSDGLNPYHLYKTEEVYLGLHHEQVFLLKDHSGVQEVRYEPNGKIIYD